MHGIGCTEALYFPLVLQHVGKPQVEHLDDFFLFSQHTTEHLAVALSIAIPAQGGNAEA